MSGTSASLRRNWCRKLNRKTHFYTIQSWRLWFWKLNTKTRQNLAYESVLEKYFLLFFHFQRSILVRRILFNLMLWKLLLCHYLGKKNSYSTQTPGQKPTDPYQNKSVMAGGITAFMSCNPFSDARKFLYCFQFLVSEVRREFLPRDVYLGFSGSLSAGSVRTLTEIG